MSKYNRTVKLHPLALSAVVGGTAGLTQDCPRGNRLKAVVILISWL